MSDDQMPNRPSHLAYQVREGENEKSYFNKVGAAWEHQDGQGYNIQLDSVPIDGRITLRTPHERVQEMRSEAQEAAQQVPAREPKRDQGQER